MVGICEIIGYESVRVSFVYMLPFVFPALLENTSVGARSVPKLYCWMHVMSKVLLLRIFMRNESIFGNYIYFYIYSNLFKTWVCKREYIFILSLLILPMACKSLLTVNSATKLNCALSCWMHVICMVLWNCNGLMVRRFSLAWKRWLSWVQAGPHTSKHSAVRYNLGMAKA